MKKTSLKQKTSLRQKTSLKQKTSLRQKTSLKQKASLKQKNQSTKNISYTDLKFSKNSRIINQETINNCKKEFCEICGKPAYGEPHHIYTRGANGPDIPENLIQLCWYCHYVIVPSGKYSVDYLLGFVSGRLKKPIDTLKNTINRARGRI